MRGVYGAKWEPAAAPLRILCIGGFFLCVHNLGDSLARAKGANAARFWRHSLYAIGVFVAARIGVNYGMEGVAWGVSASLCLQNLLMAQLANSLIGGTWSDFFAAQAPGALLAVVTGAATWLFAGALHAAHLPDLAFAIIAGGFGMVVSLVALMLLPRPWLPSMLLPRLDKMRAKLGLGAAKAISG
jgi:O-antigen/teichoic acid export membrane protein